jgi:polar amino acid transport system substrate-binding protein
MRDKTIGVQMGSSFEPYVKKEMAPLLNAKIRNLKRVVDLIQDMKSERIDFIITTKSVASAFTETDDRYQTIVITKFIPKDRYENFAIALPKNSELTARINAILDELISEGRLDELSKIWLEKNIANA